MTDRETLTIYDQKAAEYQALVDTGQGPDRQQTAFLNGLAPGSDILDLGCGPGNSAAQFAAAGHRVMATDASAEMVAIARTQPGVEARQESFDALTGTAIFDGIWANFSLLHAARDALPGHLAAIAEALRPGGLFHIGMKTGADTKRDSLGRRYTYVTETELKSLLNDAGLSPGTQWTGEDKGLDGTMAPWICMQARKHA